MASVSGATSSLGNTSLRGFGGLASGIDRDEMIEAMTAGTQSKIETQKGEVTKLQWKQEAYRNIIDQIIDIEDEYFSFTSGSNLKSASLFAKNIISMIGDDDVTKFVKASGTSAWVDNLSIKAVDQLATAATQMSESKGKAGAITTGITSLGQEEKIVELAGKQLEFGFMGATGTASEGKFLTKATFTFPTSYTTTDENGKRITKDIDYTQDAKSLVDELNNAIDENKFKIEGESFKFQCSDDGKLSILIDGKEESNYLIRSTSSALKSLGYSGGNVQVTDFNKDLKQMVFDKESTDPTNIYKSKNMLEYLNGQKLTVSYGGQSKTIELLTKDEYNALKEKLSRAATDDEKEVVEDEFAANIQNRVDKAFGSGKVKVTWDADNDPATPRALSFVNADENDQQTLTINSSNAQMRTIMGIEKNQSNKLTVDGSLWANRDKLGLGEYDKEEDLTKALADFSINGTKISGLTADTTINELIDKINSTKDVGVKASYLSGSNQFLLVASETGEGREINLGVDDSVATKIFGNTTAANKGYTDGRDAIIQVSYGNGITQELKSSTNTFNIEGLNVTVSGEFGYQKNADGSFKKVTDANGQESKVFDNTQSVSFSAKADVDKATEKVKAFFEAYNKMVEQVGTEVRTRPDKSFGPLTDAQKDEMDEKSIENWENKAKEGILFNDSAVQNFSTALENVMTTMMRNGVSYADLEKIGITMSDDYLDGGKIVFDEAKFKSAMETDPELVSNIFTGGGSVTKGLAETIEDTLTPYATRYRSDNGNSYGRLIEEAGSEKVPLSISSNWIYNQLQQMEETINTLKTRLKTEQDQYIKQFTTMESMINKFNSQSSYLSQLQG